MLSFDQDDILDWRSFCSGLGKEGTNTSSSSGARIWELLPHELRAAIPNALQTNGVRETLKLSLVTALNDLLKRQDFYREEYFKDIQLNSEARELLEQSQQGLSPNDTQRLNRLLLETSYPQQIVQSYKGCRYYSGKQFVDLNDQDSLTTLSWNEIEDTFKYMELLGPRPRKLAKLLRLMLEGYEIAEIARQVGKHRTTIPKELYGTSEKEKGENGEAINFHQSGAFEIFRAIYTGAIFALKRAQESLWSVVNRRDFSIDALQPGFNKIRAELSISKLEAIERYVDGWNWIKAQSTKGGGSVSKFGDDKSEPKVKQMPPVRQIVRMNEALHPDFHMLLTYAEGALDQDTRRQLGRHVLICEPCLADLEHIETEIVPKLERPIGIAERGQWLTARIAGRLNKASDVAGSRETEPAAVGVVKWFNRSLLHASVSYALAAAVIGLLLILLLRETQHNRQDQQLHALKQQNELLVRENAEVREQATKSAAAAEQKQELLLNAKEQIIRQLQSEKNILIAAQRSSRLPEIVTVRDTGGLATVGRDVVLNREGETNSIVKLPADLSEDVRRLGSARSVSTQPATDAMTVIGKEIQRGQSRGGGTADNLKALPISPMRTAVRTTGVTLRWLPVSEALNYEVIVVSYSKGAGKNEKERWSTNVGTQTELTLDPGTLSRGQIYLWSVRTRLAERDKVTTSPPAGFWVLDEAAAHDVDTAEHDYNSSALVLTSVYAKHGLYEEALKQISRLKDRNRHSRFVKTMERTLLQQSGKEWRKVARQQPGLAK
jgi:hypothetical protein